MEIIEGYRGRSASGVAGRGAAVVMQTSIITIYTCVLYTRGARAHAQAHAICPPRNNRVTGGARPGAVQPTGFGRRRRPHEHAVRRPRHTEGTALRRRLVAAAAAGQHDRRRRATGISTKLPT